MAVYIHFKDPNDPDMPGMLRDIPTCTGVCLFIDISKSTDLKYMKGIAYWGRKLNNTFNFLIYANHLENDVVKGIGDEIMLFVPENELMKRYERGACYAILEDMYSSIYNITNHPDETLFLDCKVSVHYCTEVYNITFLQGVNDYYGSDIDLAARLMTRCISKRIVISEAFFEKVQDDLCELGLASDTGCLGKISGKLLADFKGVPAGTGYRSIDV